MDEKWPFELKLIGGILIFVFVFLIIENFFSNIDYARAHKTYKEDIKTTIEFTNSKDKLDIDVEYNSITAKAYRYIYELVNDIDYSKDIYLKTCDDNIEITYLTKEDNSYETKSFAKLINECKYIEGDDFKITLTNNKPNRITLYIPVKYNKDYSQLIE